MHGARYVTTSVTVASHKLAADFPLVSGPPFASMPLPSARRRHLPDAPPPIALPEMLQQELDCFAEAATPADLPQPAHERLGARRHRAAQSPAELDRARLGPRRAARAPVVRPAPHFLLPGCVAAPRLSRRRVFLHRRRRGVSGFRPPDFRQSPPRPAPLRLGLDAPAACRLSPPRRVVGRPHAYRLDRPRLDALAPWTFRHHHLFRHRLRRRHGGLYPLGFPPRSAAE